MHRLFVAIRPPGEIRDLLIDLTEEGTALGWVGDDHLHLTLRFIGEVDRESANEVAAALERVRYPAFELRLEGAGRFDRRNGGALWAGVRPREPIADLAAKVDRACVSAGLEPEHRAFHPHITLARYKRTETNLARQFEQRGADLASPPFPVDRFTLFESHLSRHGASYERIASFPLR